MAGRRGRRLAVVLIVAIVVLAGLFVVADRVAVYAADRTVAGKVKQELTARDVTSAGDPRVRITGFPFLTQVARGRYNKITIAVPRPSSQGVTVDELDITATGVDADTNALIKGTGDIVADTVSGTAQLGWASVGRLINLSGYGGQGATVGPRPGGGIQVTAPISVLGVSTTVVGTGSLALADGRVQLHIDRVTTQGGQLPAVLNQLLGSIRRTLSISITIPPLPYHLQIRSVSTEQSGVAISASAQHVPISGGTGA